MINIIGSGLAGLTGAIKASEMGEKVNLISPNYSETSQSVMAMGGINAALDTKGENDSVKNHYDDTIRGGCEINNPDAVLRLTEKAPEIVKWLESLGVSFTRDENDNIDLRYFGGQKKARTAYADARTGKQLVTALISKCRQKEAQGNVKRYIGWRMLSLVIEDGKCMGVICINEDTSEIRSFEGSVILASGGYNSLFGKTSGSTLNDGYVTAKALLQGVKLANLEMIQYHPTTVQSSSKRMLITEAARGEGGNLYVIRDGKPWYFMKEWYPELAELMPRDVVSRSIYEASEAGRHEVYLDITHLSEHTVKVRLDEVYEVCTKYLNLDPTKQPIPVFPGIHYFMGGIKTDDEHKTNIEALFAAGECSCQYHGANRLGGNSLLGAIHGGYVAAESAVKCNVEVDGRKIKKSLENETRFLNSWNNSSDGIPIKEFENQLSKIMNDSMGIFRDGDDLSEALGKLNDLTTDINVNNYYEFIKINALMKLAEASLKCALARKESRGSHQRRDYPDSDDDYKKITSVIFDGEIRISFEGLK